MIRKEGRSLLIKKGSWREWEIKRDNLGDTDTGG